jgi:hypothetical protein
VPLDQFCRTPRSTAKSRSRGEEALHTAFELRKSFVHFDDVYSQLFELLALAEIRSSSKIAFYIRSSSMRHRYRLHALPVEMSERSIERRVGAIELGKGAGMKLFETSDKATKLCFRRRVGRFISERGPPDEFGRRYLARHGRLFLDARPVLCRDRDDQSLRRSAHVRLLITDIIISMIMPTPASGHGSECGQTRLYVR